MDLQGRFVTLIIRYPTHNASPERNFVGVFEVATNGNPSGNGGDFDRELPQPLGKIKRRSVAFHGRAKGKNYFLD